MTEPERPSQRTYDDGVADGYAQGAGSTAEVIRNRLWTIALAHRTTPIPRRKILDLIAELDRDYDLEPSPVDE